MLDGNLTKEIPFELIDGKKVYKKFVGLNKPMDLI
jgi:hypothetical protein